MFLALLENALSLEINNFCFLSSKIFWFQSDNGQKKDRSSFSLWEANLDGSHQKSLVANSNMNPVSCTYDYESNVIYWIHKDVGKHSIESYDYNSKQLRTVQDLMGHSKGLLFFDRSLIYGDLDAMTILKIPVNSTGAQAVLVEDIDWVLDIKAFHGSVQTGKLLLLLICSIV